MSSRKVSFVVPMGKDFSFLIPDIVKAKLRFLVDRAHRLHSGYVRIEIKAYQKPRSTGKHSQNNHVNGHIRQIAEYTGHTFDETKEHIKAIAITEGWPVEVDEAGIPLIDPLYKTYIPISEGDASVDDDRILINVIHRIAAEMGVRLKEEDDFYEPG